MSPWWELSVTLAADLSDDAGALFLEAGALGVELQSAELFLPHFGSGARAIPPAPGEEVLIVSYDGTLSEQEVTQSATETLAELGLERADLRVRRREDTAWAEAWKQFFRPLQVGPRLWIVPSWEAKSFKAPAGSVPLTLDPGMAFGTGQHATTALCLKVIDLHVKPGKSVIDVGTGSGILAIAAAKLGAGPVLATDNDPVAVDVTRENLALNHVEDRVTASIDDLTIVPGEFDYVIANIIAPVLIELAEPLVSHTRAGGTLVLSGVLASQEAEVTEAIVRAAEKLGHPMKHHESLREGEWVAIVLRG